MCITEEEEVAEDVEQVVPSQGENLQVRTSEVEEPASPGGGKEGSTRNTTPTMPATNTTTTTTQQKSSAAAEPMQQPEETFLVEEQESIEMATKVNDHLSRLDEAEGISGSNVVEIVLHDWKLGHLQIKVCWSSNYTTWEHIKDMREDYPKMTVRYIVSNKVSRFKRGGDQVLQWVKKVERNLGCAVQRIVRLYKMMK